MQNPYNKGKLLLWWFPIAIAIIGCVASFYCWRWINNREQEYIGQVVQSTLMAWRINLPG